MVFHVLVYIVSFIFLITVLIDFIPIISDLIQRVHMGRIKDKNRWNKLITRKGMKWLAKTPKIKVTDNTRFVILDILKGNYTKSTLQHWQEAALVLGLTEYLKSNDDEKVKRALIKYVNNKFNNKGEWKDRPKFIDSAILAYSILKLDNINTIQYKNAFDYIYKLIKEHIGEDGTVGYRKSMNGYRYVDTIGFICPFLVSYGVKFNKNECIDLAIKQIKEYEKNGMLSKLKVPCHAYNIQNKLPLGLYGWGRGLGWYGIGLVDAWCELPHNNIYKESLETSVIKFAKAVLDLQQAKGNWNWTATRNETTPDSSVTATLSWFLLNASRIDEISNECLIATEKAMSFLMKVTRRNGAIDFSQGDTKDIGVYSNLFGIMPFTQGFAIRSINLLEREQGRLEDEDNSLYSYI